MFNNDTGSHPDEILNVTLRMLNVPGESPRYVLYLMDNVLTNPAQMWLRNGAPVFPEQQLRARIRAVEVRKELTSLIRVFAYLPTIIVVIFVYGDVRSSFFRSHSCADSLIRTQLTTRAVKKSLQMANDLVDHFFMKRSLKFKREIEAVMAPNIKGYKNMQKKAK